jgi:hypothetical protein
MAYSPETMSAIYAAVLFVIISMPQVYKFVDSLVGKLLNVEVSNSEGCPTNWGIIIHAAVYGLVVYLLMTNNKQVVSN